MTLPAAPPAPDPGAAWPQALVELGKISSQIAVMDERLKAIPDHEARIRLLENAHAKLLGGATVVGAIAGGLAGWVALLIAHH